MRLPAGDSQTISSHVFKEGMLAFLSSLGTLVVLTDFRIGSYCSCSTLLNLSPWLLLMPAACASLPYTSSYCLLRLEGGS